MALRRKPPVIHRPRARALVASGQQIDLSDRNQLAAFKRRAQKDWWQERAIDMDNEVSLLGFAHDYVRDSMSKIALLPALISDDPKVGPIPLDDDNAPDGLDPELCRQILDRFAPIPDFMGSLARKLDVVGEAHVALIPDTSEIDGERCEVFSPLELFTKGNDYYYREDPTDSKGTKLDPSSFVFRVWQPDPSWRMLPTSHMRRLITISDTLLLLTQVIRGISKSRLVTGGRILAVADELSLESAVADHGAPTEDAGDGEGRTDPVIEDFFAAAEQAVLDPEGPSGIIPLVFRGPMDVLKGGLFSIPMDRPYDETLIKIRQELREEIANGVNLPRELLLGIGATNHWNAEEIKSQTWETHLEPRGMGIVGALTSAFYRPQLLANGIDPDIVRRCVVGYDPSLFLGVPDLAESAGEAFNNYAISWAAYRRVKGYSEADEPDLDEVHQRLWIKQQERVTIRDTGTTPAGEIEAAPQGAEDAPVEDANAVTEKVTPAGPTDSSAPAPATSTKAAALVAAAAPSALDRLGPKLVGIERDLRTRLHTEANLLAASALDRAGQKVRQKARNRPAVAAQIEGVPYAQIPARIGAAGVLALGLKEHELLALSLAGLEVKYRTQVARAQKAAAQAAASASGRPFDDSDLDRRMADARDAGWAVLAAGITALVTGLLYNPSPSAPEHGEFDETSIVPLGLIRASLDRAGGAQVGAPAPNQVPALVEPRSASAAPAGGGATAGPSMLDEFKQQLGIVDDKYTWLYGDAPRREFQPHLDLDGQDFTAWDDPVLANGDSWPPVDYFAPSDHDGCACDYAATFTQADAGAPA